MKRIVRHAIVPLIAVALALTLGGCAGASSVGASGGGASGSAAGGDGSEAAGSTEGVCPPAPVVTAQPSTASPTPTPAPTLDPIVARELRGAITAVRAIDGVAAARYDVTFQPNDVPDPDCPGRTLDRHSFSAVFTVAMTPDSTADAAAEVPTTMATHLAWTAVNLVLTVPAAAGRVATTVEYDGTFDQSIPVATSQSVAEGLATIASTPHVAGVSATIPYTMRVDYGSLTVGADTYDPATLEQIRTVIDSTAFRDTTLHGSFGNGAKP
jgi:hypothetical protein